MRDPRSTPLIAAPEALHQRVLDIALRRPGSPAVATRSASLTYGDLADRALALAAHLSGGVGVGSRVLVALPNTPATIVAGLALGIVGAIPVEVNRGWTAAVLHDVVRSSRVAEVVVWGRDARLWAGVLQGTIVQRVWVVHPGSLPPSISAALGRFDVRHVHDDGRVDDGDRHLSPPAIHQPTADAAALVLYTSGSTGVAQGVVQTVRNIDANSRSIVAYLGLTEADRALVTLPLYYCYGRSVLQTHLYVGGSLYIDDRFALPRVVLEAMAEEGCTGFAGVPTTFEILRRQVDVGSMTFPRLRYVTQAGGAMSLDTTAWVRAAFAPAQLYVMYGQTEATSRLSYLPPDRAPDKPGSIGIPIPGVELRVVDEDGHVVPDGELGNLVAQGDNVTPGYLDRAADTAAILRDGWLWTGDLAVRDADGFFFHRGRAKEILKVGGHRVSPAEIEQALSGHPGIQDVAVCGMPDPLMGEVPVAFVVPTPGLPETSDLPGFARTVLPAYQVPARFLMVDSLPRNEAGKILRAELAARVRSEPMDVVADPREMA